VTNNSDEDIYLNLAESYYVDNGLAHDYYQARTYVYTSKSITSVGAKASYAVAKTASEKGESIEFAEKSIVGIPAHSCKVFEEFSVATTVFRECGFVRDPSKKENAVREYNGYTSPKVIENRLMFYMGDVAIPVTNVFYVSQYQNISIAKATGYVKVERCDGFKKDVKVNTHSANNRFYITYSSNDLMSSEGNQNDRKAQSFGKSSAGKFNDGLYER
jgi:hypothetical protein